MARMPVAGEVIDDVFRVETEIDSGNFGSVYRVHDMLEDRTLALKVLRPGPHDENELRARFEREASLIYSLQHRHIVRVYYYGETNSGLPYMAMEYLEGTDLRTLLYHHGALSHSLVKRITLETLSALHAAHELNIIHRDLKPANIFLVKDGGKGHVKVLDFGFAKTFDDSGPTSPDITNAGTLVGTPAYMAPELVHKKHIGPAADLYAMGLIMAEMLKGDRVIEIDEVYDTILFQASPNNIKFGDYVTASPFADIVSRATQKSLDRRYRTALEMGNDLGGLPSYEPEPTPDTSAPIHRRLIITDDISDSDLTVPRALGLPSEQELARLMNRGDGPSEEPTVELGSVAEKLRDAGPAQGETQPAEPLPVRQSGPQKAMRTTGAEAVVRNNTSSANRAVKQSPVRSRGPERGRDPRQAAPNGRDSNSSPLGLDVEIDDLSRLPRREDVSHAPPSGVRVWFWGFFIGAVLLVILVGVFVATGRLPMPLK